MWRVIIRVTRVWIVVIGIWMVAGTAFAQEATVRGTGNAADSLLARDLYAKGMQQRSAGQLAAAEKTFEQVVRLQPDDDAAYFQLAQIYIEGKDFSAAE